MDCTAIILTIGIILQRRFFYCFRLWLCFGGYACAYTGDVGKSGGYFCTAVESGPAGDYYVQSARRL